MKRAIFLPIILTLLLIPCPAQVKITSMSFTGEVIAYIESNIISPRLSSVPNAEVLIVKIKKSNKIKSEFIKVLNEYFDEKNSLPDKIFKGGKWKFKIMRQLDCDSILKPDYSGLLFELDDSKSVDEEWVLVPPPPVKFIRSEESQNIPPDKILPCYQILSLKEK